MRVVGGEFRGRALAGPKSDAIRPTTDRTRESLFNILQHAHAGVLEGTRVLDLFAGTGAVGIEALSRGCRSGILVEQSVEGRGIIQSNIETLGCKAAPGSCAGMRPISARSAISNPSTFSLPIRPMGRGLAKRRSPLPFPAAGWCRAR